MIKQAHWKLITLHLRGMGITKCYKFVLKTFNNILFFHIINSEIIS